MHYRSVSCVIFFVAGLGVSPLHHSKADEVSDAVAGRDQAYSDYFEALLKKGLLSPEEKKALRKQIIEPAQQKVDAAAQNAVADTLEESRASQSAGTQKKGSIDTLSEEDFNRKLEASLRKKQRKKGEAAAGDSPALVDLPSPAQVALGNDISRSQVPSSRGVEKRDDAPKTFQPRGDRSVPTGSGLRKGEELKGDGIPLELSF